jgi:hypothetical protein
LLDISNKNTMNLHSDPRKAQLYNQLMFQFQRTQERIIDIETENTVIDRKTPIELANLKRRLVEIQQQLRSLY